MEAFHSEDPKADNRPVMQDTIVVNSQAALFLRKDDKPVSDVPSYKEPESESPKVGVTMVWGSRQECRRAIIGRLERELVGAQRKIKDLSEALNKANQDADEKEHLLTSLQ